MALFRWIVGIALFWSLSAAAVVADQVPEGEQRVKHVVIISFDQGGYDAIRDAKNMPTFHRMAREGAHTWRAFTVIPSVTYPGHVSMLTGVGVQAHQVDSNEKPKGEDDDDYIVKVPTIFSLAKEAEGRELTTAVYLTRPQTHRINIKDSIDHNFYSGNSKKVAANFKKTFTAERHNLNFLYFWDIDGAGHSYGKYSKEWLKALKVTDNALKSVYETLRDAGVLEETVLILTADHGGHNFKNKDGETKGRHGTTKPDDVEIPWVVWGKGVKENHEITQAVVVYDTAATALWLLGVPVPESFWGRPIVSAFE